ncbi:hypothetical protein M8Z33_20830 [Streptomyces sp. ZAF1911]|uniref:hypothetical protein n=1 Tax=Streptomyces sp. ZAF1911 TaxID=2944129 RepID=UPI00237B4E40|nr:hypothetical protein [Streptomyces sp. ZAF1911]MDD9379061.1 hypothetical protein [Streptomyces sp. ZAF1911]
MSDRATFLIGHRRYESSSGAVGLDLDQFWEDRWVEHVRRAPVLDVPGPERVAVLAEVRDAVLGRWAGARRDVRAAVRGAAPRALVGRGLAPPLTAAHAAEAREVIIRAHASAL